MAYTSNIPTPNQRFKDSQSLIQSNFTDIANALAINHEAFNLPNVGKHKFLQMPIQGAAPATAANELGLYTKTGITTNIEMFIRRESSGSEIEFTGSLQSANGWTRLPSGILLKWGQGTLNAGQPGTINFPVAATIPVFTAIYMVQLTPIGGGNPNIAATLATISTTGFQAWRTERTSTTTASVSVQYFAIGI